MNRYFAAMLSLLVIVVLADCSTPPLGSPSAADQAGQGGGPTPTPGSSSSIDLQPFIEMAGQAGCARDQNRLFVIDGEMVLWERRDLGCADASYEISLFGPSPDRLLCRSNDSIAGPVLSCDDQSLQPMFQTISGHTEEVDLGLGGAHTVELTWGSQ
jgi:hypothetical protein